MTYQEANQKGRALLEEKHMEDASVDAWLLLEFVTGMNRTRFFVENYKEMPEAEEKQYFALIKRRRERIPLQHLTGTQEFMGLDFRVNEHVLIPRQDTELLVLEAEKRLGILKTKQAQVLDMCTGSGCIAISLKKRNPEIVCCGADISEEALRTARENAQVLDTEILAKEAPAHLKKGGWLYMEIGYDQSEAVEQLLSQNGFTDIRTEKDLAGLDRVVCGVYNK